MGALTGREAELADAFTMARPRLVRVAYAILGSRAEAEDAVADCWLSLVAADRGESVHDVDAWTTVAVSRRALDTLRSARLRRETYVGPWLPEPVVAPTWRGRDPAERVTHDETLGYALLVVLETLTPTERTAWVLHDVFGVPFDDIAETVGRTPAAVRQLAARARAHIADRRPRVDVDAAEHRATLERFLRAAIGGDLDALVRALDPLVVLTSDGGGEVTAARHPVHGADKVARLLRGLARQLAPGDRVHMVTLNGDPGLGVFSGPTLTTAISFTLSGETVSRVDVVRAPGKLGTGTLWA